MIGSVSGLQTQSRTGAVNIFRGYVFTETVFGLTRSVIVEQHKGIATLR
jgi:hypothetical protein